MSNKFLSTSSSSDLSKQFVFAGSLGANNLNPSQAVKTDSARRLVSANLNVSDILGLQARLDSTITTPYENDLQAYNFITPSSNLNALSVSNANLASGFLNLSDKTTNISLVEDITTLEGDVMFLGKITSITRGPIMTSQTDSDFQTTGSIGCQSLNCGGTLSLLPTYPSVNTTLDELQNSVVALKLNEGLSKLGGKYSQTGAAVQATTTTSTSLVSTGVGSMIFALSTLKAGFTYDVCVSGTIKTKDNSQELKLDLNLGATLLHTTTFIDLDNVGSIPLSFEWLVRFTCKSPGTTAPFYSCSKFFYSAGTSANSLRGWLQNSSSVQNTTISNTLDVRGQWSSNQVENNITINSLCVSKSY